MKKRIGLMLMGLVLLPSLALAQPTVVRQLKYSVSGAYQGYLTSGVSTLQSVPSDTYEALIQADGGAIRYTIDGTNPGPQDGYKLKDESYVTFDASDQISDFRWTLDSGESGVTLHVTYFGLL